MTYISYGLPTHVVEASLLSEKEDLTKRVAELRNQLLADKAAGKPIFIGDYEYFVALRDRLGML